MSQSPQRIVFAQNADGRPADAVLIFGAKGGFKARRAGFNRKAVSRKVIHQCFAGEHLFAVIFGVVENGVGHSDQIVTLGVHCGKKRVFHHD
ncbi:hypothetical protein SDC9_201085 [bioreactor metagenome]|uniref:Uncharacterized protein n=1 Tax=bioreactor metagenome TaxID=1076179 RepID=A0A645IQ12_9ZZZZ